MKKKFKFDMLFYPNTYDEYVRKQHKRGDIVMVKEENYEKERKYHNKKSRKFIISLVVLVILTNVALNSFDM